MEGSIIKAARIHNDSRKEPSMIITSASESRSCGFPQMTKAGNKIIFAWTDNKEKKIKTAMLDMAGP